jgi:hypothetical protein
LRPFPCALRFFKSEVCAVLLEVDLYDKRDAIEHVSLIAIPLSWLTYASKLPWCLLSSASASSVSPAFSSTMPTSSCTFKFSWPY